MQVPCVAVLHEVAIEAILARPAYQGIRFFHSGDVPLNTVYNRVINEESGILMAITSGVIAVILVLFFRSAVGVVGPLVTPASRTMPEPESQPVPPK